MVVTKVKFCNHNFVSGIFHLPYQAFRHRFHNFEHHNKHYQDHFFNDFLGRAYCTNTCNICIEHDSTYYSRIDYKLSRFKDSTYHPKNSIFCPFARSYEQDDQLFQFFTTAVPYNKCTYACSLPVVHKPHFDCFSYKTMLTYAYYTNLTPHDKSLYAKCHSFPNDLDNDVLKILIDKFGSTYGIPHLRLFTILKLSIRELKMGRDNILHVGLDLNLDFKSYPGLIDHALFFLPVSFRNKIKYINSFLP